MASSFKAYVEAYNNGNYPQALSFIDPATAQEICGSGSAYAMALRETHNVENLDYSFIKLPLAVPEGKDRARADVSYDAFDPVTGEQIDFDAVIGLAFSKVNGDWLLAEEFPLGASSFC